MVKNIIKLPEGHKWREDKFAPSHETWFVCDKCGATFIHEYQDDSTHYDEGDGTCDEN